MISRLLGFAVALLSCSMATAAGSSAAAEASTDVRLGQKIYAGTCASCHGAKAEGAPNWQKPNVLGELPAPPHDETGHSWRHSDGELFEMIAEGWRDPFNKTDRLTMPGFGDVLTETEISAVITYLKTLWTDDQRLYQREKTAETSLDSMN